MAVAAELLLLLALVGCSGQSGQSGQSTPSTAPSAPTVLSAASATTSISPTPRPTLPGVSPSPSVSSGLVIATATPNSRPSLTPPSSLPLRISAQLEPRAPRAGTDFVLRLTIANDGDRPTEGVYIATSGPWDRWTVLEISPTGAFARDAAGWHIVSPLHIPLRQTGILELRITANEPSEEQLTFAVREAEPGELR